MGRIGDGGLVLSIRGLALVIVSGLVMGAGGTDGRNWGILFTFAMEGF